MTPHTAPSRLAEQPEHALTLPSQGAMPRRRGGVEA